MSREKIKIFTFFLVLLLLISGCTLIRSSQIWQKTFGDDDDDNACSILQNNDGEYVVVGGIGRGICGFKLDKNGNNTGWGWFYGTINRIYPKSLQRTRYIGYITAGYLLETTSYDVFVMKFSEHVIYEWWRTFGGDRDDEAYSIQQTIDRGYIVAGYTESFGFGGKDVYILKLNANGDLVWQKTFGGGNDDIAYSVQQTIDGGYIVAGYTESFGAGEKDVYILKLDSNGNLVWQKTFGGSNDDVAYSIQQTSDGGYIVAGNTHPFGAGEGDAYILKLDKNGDLVWRRIYGGNNDDVAYSIQQTIDGGYIVAGYTESFGFGGKDVYILKLNANGGLVWQKTFGGNNDDVAYSIQQTIDRGYIAAGYTNSFGAGGYDVYILKLDADGNTGPYPQ